MSVLIQKGKRYLKTRYQTHCIDETSKISSDSTSFALSDPKENAFICDKSKEVDSEVCQESLELVQNIQSIHDTVKHVGSRLKTFMTWNKLLLLFVST